MNQVDRNTPYFIHCAGGYRSVIAASILKSRGFDQLINIQGGFKSLVEVDHLPFTEYAEQITEL